MNNVDAFLALNAPKAKDEQLEEEIVWAMSQSPVEDLEKAMEASKDNVLTTSSDEMMQTLKQFMESAPRKLKRKIKGKENSFSGTLLARLKKK